MKTKLLLLFALLSSAFSFAQNPSFFNLNAQNVTSTTVTINFQVQNNCTTYAYRAELATNNTFSSNFQTTTQIANNYCNSSPISHSGGFIGLLPNTTYFYRARVQISSNLYYSSIESFTTAGLTPIFGTTTAAPAVTSALINYALVAGVGQSNITVSWGTNAASLTSTLTATPIADSGPSSAAITGLNPETIYYYKVEAVSANGTALPVTGSFTTLSLASITIAEYNFDNTYNNLNGNTPFSSTPSTSFVNDRAGQSLKALRIGTASSNACATTITTLPIANTSRTVSLWYKNDSFSSGTPAIFVYGANANNQYFGTYGTTAGQIVLWSYVTDHNFGGAFPQNTWRHLVMTHDGTNVKLYVDGVFVGQKTTTLATGNAIGFKLGSTAGAIEVDDLKIYNVALSQAEISNLFTYNSLVSGPSISGVSATAITSNAATINYSLNANSAATTSVVKYGTTSGNLTSTVTGFSATGNTATPGTTSLTGLSANTQYFYKVEGTNSTGTEQSPESSFNTLANPMSTIAEYNFDNTYNNILGSRPFTANTGTSFTQDRNGNANSALNLVSIGTTAVIPNLPYNSDSRTISVWVKNYSYNWFVASACPFSYGTTANAYELAMYQSVFALNPYPGPFASHYVDLTPLNITNALNTWNHYVVSYNGTTSKIYKDGALLSSSNTALTTANNSDIFRLGLLNALNSDYFDGAIDDLKIYNYALTDAEVTSLFTNNSLLATDNFNLNNLEVSLYPNPANDVLNIEMTNEVKSIEIYNIQGQKVKSSNQKQINVADLAAGMYMIRIQDADNAIATKKFVKQ